MASGSRCLKGSQKVKQRPKFSSCQGRRSKVVRMMAGACCAHHARKESSKRAFHCRKGFVIEQSSTSSCKAETDNTKHRHGKELEGLAGIRNPEDDKLASLLVATKLGTKAHDVFMIENSVLLCKCPFPVAHPEATQCANRTTGAARLCASKLLEKLLVLATWLVHCTSQPVLHSSFAQITHIPIQARRASS